MKEDPAPSAVKIGMGLASPLWLLFSVTASAGAAVWWWTRWARPGSSTKPVEPEKVMEHAEPTAAPLHPSNL